MIKCPYCGSIRHHNLFETTYHEEHNEDENLVRVCREYECASCELSFYSWEEYESTEEEERVYGYDYEEEDE